MKDFSRKFFILFLLIYLFGLSTACDENNQKGFIMIRGINEGTYEIFKTSGTNLSEITSETNGKYNEPKELTIGNYLVLADCSYQEVIIRPNETVEIVSQKIEFIAPRALSEEDLFSVQCMRYEKLLFKQHLKGQLSLQLLPGNHSILVGMTPIHLHFENDLKSDPQLHQYHLAAVTVKSPIIEAQNSLFYVSPNDNQLAITQGNNFDKWQFLLPGKYQITLNGSKIDVELVEDQILEMEPSLLKVKTPSNVDLDLITKVKGKPQEYIINDDHLLTLNYIYPMLEGPITFNLAGSNHQQIFELKKNELTEIPLKSIQINLGCSPWDWTCIGSKEVLLFKEDQYYPFIRSSSDIPILYSNDQVFLSLLGSHGIRYKVPEKESVTLNAGFLKIIPTPQYNQGVTTDLARVEPLNSEFSGYTLDIAFDRDTTLNLLEGKYQLVRYNSTSQNEGERNFFNKSVVVQSGKTMEIEFPYFLSKRQFTFIKAKLESELQSKHNHQVHNPSERKDRKF